jgi:hypothetical protein
MHNLIQEYRHTVIQYNAAWATKCAYIKSMYRMRCGECIYIFVHVSFRQHSVLHVSFRKNNFVCMCRCMCRSDNTVFCMCRSEKKNVCMCRSDYGIQIFACIVQTTQFFACVVQTTQFVYMCRLDNTISICVTTLWTVF